MNPSVILGIEFLVANKAKIDLNAMKITPGEKMVEIIPTSFEQEPDDKIEVLSKIYYNVDRKIPENIDHY